MELNLKKFREGSGMSQRRLADEIDKSFRTIQQWESGESFPNAEMVWRLCEVFGTDPNTFLGWYEAHPREEPPGLSAEEGEILGCYRSSTPQWRTNIAMTARAAAGESLKTSERGASPEQGAGGFAAVMGA